MISTSVVYCITRSSEQGHIYTFAKGGKMGLRFSTYVAQDIEILKEFILL